MDSQHETESKIFQAKYYDGMVPQAQEITVAVGTVIEFRYQDGAHLQYVDPHTLRVDEDFGGKRRIFLNDSQYILTDDSLLKELLRVSPKKTTIVRLVIEKLERNWPVVCLSLVLLTIVGYHFIVHGIPYLSEQISKQVPLQTVQKMGEQSIKNLDRFDFFAASALPSATKVRIKKRYLEICTREVASDLCRIEFRSSKYETLNVNALAVPGGSVILMDGLVELAKNDEEILSILAHELGHQKHNHALRGLIESALVTVSYAMMLGDIGALPDIFTAAPAVLVQAKFSRSHETEADSVGFEILKRNNISTVHFANIMERILKNFGQDVSKRSDEKSALSIISTHPDTAERIAIARRLAK